MEFATAALRFGHEDLDAIVQGSSVASDDSTFAAELAVAVVAQSVGHIAHHVDIRDPAGAAELVTTLRRVLTQVS